MRKPRLRHRRGRNPALSRPHTALPSQAEAQASATKAKEEPTGAAEAEAAPGEGVDRPQEEGAVLEEEGPRDAPESCRRQRRWSRSGAGGGFGFGGGGSCSFSFSFGGCAGTSDVASSSSRCLWSSFAALPASAAVAWGPPPPLPAPVTGSPTAARRRWSCGTGRGSGDEWRAAGETKLEDLAAELARTRLLTEAASGGGDPLNAADGELPTPPALASSWDWPLSRPERKVRVWLIERELLACDREELLEIIRRLGNRSEEEPQ
eukprot:TRINITY_DN3591_c2_g1_i1.p1 TRINITY_DN3591_c2_g1~~TRINITY_DN3591_c2_g1_i1.p1  ORF type:complete len:264 (+),score=53.21 TRINITY_DN3591_c2_g1_i1:136-927(+)